MRVALWQGLTRFLLTTSTITMAKILIIGCGHIGSHLAQTLSDNGHEVTGLKRHPPGNSSRINYVAADITNASALAGLADDFEQIVFIVSADGRNEQSYRDVYEAGLNQCLAKFPEQSWLFVSSSSVYGQSKGEWVDENTLAHPGNLNSRFIRQAEQKLTKVNPDNIIVRFSGIYGPGRDYLLRMVRQTPTIQQQPPYFTNRIHQQDCVGVLSFLLAQRLAGRKLEQCYLASDDDPAPLWEVVSWLAKRMDCAPPMVKMVDADAPMNKRCNNYRLKALGYRFHYPSYQEGYAELIDQT
jgi:nucleoside-diphosphate-sugar epimerase